MIKHPFGTVLQRLKFKLHFENVIKKDELKIFTSQYTVDCLAHLQTLKLPDACAN
jgi:hypothetical protein